MDLLKIDGSFVRNLEHDRVDRVMTQTINDVAHILGMKTVAEYAENAQIIERLRGMGVDYAQGYGIGRPTPLLVPAVA